MATAVTDLITTSALPDALRVIYSAELEVTATPNLVYDQFTQEKRDFQAKKGQLVYWTIYDQIPYAITPLTKNKDVDGGQVTDFQVSLTVDEYGDAIGTTEKLDLLSYHGPIGDIVRDLLSPQMAGSLDVLARNAFIGTGSTYRTFGGSQANRAALTDTDVITEADLRKAAHLLSIRRIPTIGGQYIAIANPSVVYDIRNSAFWKDANLYAGSTNIFNGEEGMLHGVRFIKTDHARIENGGTIVAQSSLSGGTSANTNQITVASATGFAVGQEITILSSTTADAVNTGTDGNAESVRITVISGTTFTLATRLKRAHAINSRVVNGLTVFPVTFLGATQAVGKGIVLPPEVRVALPTDKLRRMNYIGWYMMLGYGVLRDWALQTLEVASSAESMPAFYP